MPRMSKQTADILRLAKAMAENTYEVSKYQKKDHMRLSHDLFREYMGMETIIRLMEHPDFFHEMWEIFIEE